MKYTIEGFNQEEVIKLGNLDVVDLVILRWIVDFEPNMAKKEKDGETYFWVNYQSLLEALPILKLGKRSLYDRLMKMCDLKILKHKNIKENGNYSYYTFDGNYINLVQKQTSIDMKQTSKGYEDNFQTLTKTTSKQNNSSIKETHLLNNSNNYIVPVSPTDEICCESICSNKHQCSKQAKLEINNHYFCGQHARIYLTKLGYLEINDDNDKQTKMGFKKPTIDEIKSYCQERKNNINAEKFIDYYESNGWKVGRNSMKDWKATIRTWEKNQEEKAEKIQTYQSKAIKEQNEARERFLRGEIQ